MDTSEEKAAEVWRLHNENLTIREISAAINVPKSTVSDIIKRFETTGKNSSNRVGKCGRKRSLSPRMERRIVRESEKNPQATARDIQQSVGGAATIVHINTVKRTLSRYGRRSYRPVKAPSLSSKQQKVRLEWARKHAHWTENEWSKVRKSYL